MIKMNLSIKMLALTAVIIFALSCSEDEQSFPRTRLFKPVVTKDLVVQGNTIIVNMGKSEGALYYNLQISRDTFKTVDYSIEIDTNYVVINAELVGEELFWNTRYQIRAKAYADEAKYNSLVADLGNVRTSAFPSNLNTPDLAKNDVIDNAVKITWARTGNPITSVGVFEPTDLRLARPLSLQNVLSEEEAVGTKIVTGLSPEVTYQIAIYDEVGIRGWNRYTTKAAKVDKSLPNVIDITGSTDPDAAINAYTTANEGDIIVLKKGRTYNLPQSGTTDADKSITFLGDHGFEPNKAKLYTTGNWNILTGAMIDHIRFIDLEIEGEDIGGDYVFNPDRTGTTTLSELTFEDCIIHDVRGIIRIRTDMFLTNYNIKNTIVYNIGNYGLITCDTDGDGKAAVDNIVFENSTFSKVTVGIVTRQNTQSVVIDNCTFDEFPQVGAQIFRFRGADGFDESINGVTVSNSIFGHAWDPAETEVYEINAVDGLTETNISITNVYATSDFAVSAGNEIPGLPSTVYSGGSKDLWVDRDNLDFSFKDSGFAGSLDSGDPRWRPQ